MALIYAAFAFCTNTCYAVEKLKKWRQRNSKW